MKKLLYLIGGGILFSFALLCFFDFFLAWNIENSVSHLMMDNRNLDTDIKMSFPVGRDFYEYFHGIGSSGLQRRFAFSEMLDCLFPKKNSYGEYVGFLAFTRENWLQLSIFAVIAVMLILKVFAPNSISKKTLGLAFLALTVLAAWVLVRDFITQWRYMFGSERYGSPRWDRYWFESQGSLGIPGRGETSKFRVFLCIALHAGQNLLLVAAFGAMAAVCMTSGVKGLFFLPAFIAVAYAAFMFLCNLTGWGFALKWTFGSALVFLIVDGLLAAGLFVTALAAKDD